MKSLAIPFAKLLHNARTERPILQWLKEHPQIFERTFTFTRYVTAEFPFGSDFRADFVVLGPFSGGFDVTFVEAECHKARLFTRTGKPAKCLVDGITQIDAWRTFIEKNRPCVLRELSKFVHKRELLHAWGHEPMCNAGMHLYDPRIALNWNFAIVIGRFADLSAEEVEYKTSFRMNHGIEVMTYDRLLRNVEETDRSRRGIWDIDLRKRYSANSTE